MIGVSVQIVFVPLIFLHLVFFLTSFTLYVLRLHDINIYEFYIPIFLLLVNASVVGIIFLFGLIILLMLKNMKDSNQYGDAPQYCYPYQKIFV